MSKPQITDWQNWERGDIVVRIEPEHVAFHTTTPLFRIYHRGKEFNTQSLREFHSALEKAVNQRIKEVI